jgi:L-2-hydroxyglutarate oxidase
LVKTDVIVVGAGAIGSSIARHLALLGHRVVVLEKEAQPALHQSSRNSGVVHVGYNLEPGSLKARFCVEGNRRLRKYCRERNIPFEQGGILVLARNEKGCATLAELHRRALANGVTVGLVGPDDIRHIEPHARGVQGLHAPDGASFDATAYVHSLLEEASRHRALVRYNTRVLRIDDRAGCDESSPHVDVQTTDGAFSAQLVVNCAGLYADRLAGDAARDLRIVPFRGYYAELRSEYRDLVRSHIYAVPDLGLPFLGLHCSRRVDGRVTLGPGAMLALGREAYRFTDVSPRDCLSILTWPGFYRLFTTRGFSQLALRELVKSVSLRPILAEAKRLLPSLSRGCLMRSFAGNRAQLVSRSGRLIEDLVVRETPRAVHILNAVSPGLTCSLPFGEAIAARCHERLTNDTISPSPNESWLQRVWTH